MDEEILESVPAEPDREELAVRLAAAEAENRLYRLAPGLGVSPAAVPYLARLCPGTKDDETARAALEKLLCDLPGLRQTERPPRGFRIGAGVRGDKTPEEDLLRAAFGIR